VNPKAVMTLGTFFVFKNSSFGAEAAYMKICRDPEPATMDDAWKKSVEIGEAVKADFVYAASWIFVAVFKFKILLNPEKIKEFSLGERLNAMLKDLGSDN
jgi:hypothetical protein